MPRSKRSPASSPKAGPALADDLRVDFDRLSAQVGNHDAVMELLARCPVEA